MKNYLKNELKHLPMTLLICITFYGIATLASSYAIGSGDIEFDNTGTEIQSTNVQGAVNEVFQHATDYNEIKSTIGSGTLNTTSQNIIGAINGLNSQIANKTNVISGLSSPTGGTLVLPSADEYIIYHLIAIRSTTEYANVIIGNISGWQFVGDNTAYITFDANTRTITFASYTRYKLFW